jgi:hypothetical protein
MSDIAPNELAQQNAPQPKTSPHSVPVVTRYGDHQPSNILPVSDRTIATVHSHNVGMESSKPIFVLAIHCKTLFDECAGQIHDVNSRAYGSLDQYIWRFEQWSTYTGAFANPDRSLDRRLRRKPQIRAIVVRLLFNMRRHLAQCESLIMLCSHYL